MFSIFSGRKSRSAVPEQIYGIVVAQSRNEKFFTAFGVEDTVMGRFEILALHVFLFSRRMKQDGGKVAMEISQEVFDLFVSDIDRALRELGIGDTSVPKRKKKMVRSFYGQIEDFDGPLDEGDRNLLEERINKRFFGSRNEACSGLIAEYMLAVSEKMSDMTMQTFTSGGFVWPEFDGSAA